MHSNRATSGYAVVRWALCPDAGARGAGHCQRHRAGVPRPSRGVARSHQDHAAQPSGLLGDDLRHCRRGANLKTIPKPPRWAGGTIRRVESPKPYPVASCPDTCCSRGGACERVTVLGGHLVEGPPSRDRRASTGEVYGRVPPTFPAVRVYVEEAQVERRLSMTACTCDWPLVLKRPFVVPWADKRVCGLPLHQRTVTRPSCRRSHSPRQCARSSWPCEVLAVHRRRLVPPCLFRLLRQAVPWTITHTARRLRLCVRPRFNFRGSAHPACQPASLLAKFWGLCYDQHRPVVFAACARRLAGVLNAGGIIGLLSTKGPQARVVFCDSIGVLRRLGLVRVSKGGLSEITYRPTEGAGDAKGCCRTRGIIVGCGKARSSPSYYRALRHRLFKPPPVRDGRSSTVATPARSVSHLRRIRE